MDKYIIAVDGPAGAGKSTVCDDVAKELKILHLDTGATYRTLALALLKMNVDTADVSAVVSSLDNINIEIGFENGNQIMYIDGEDVTPYIRTNEISQAASSVSTIPEVRAKLVALQRKTAEKISMIVDGRDIGTCVFPKAKYKFYITADVSERARRRCKQLAQQGTVCDVKTLEAEIAQRDYRDMNRAVSPLKRADDALLIDCTNMTQKEVADTVINTVCCRKK